MPTAQQKQSEFVERAMRLARDYAHSEHAGQLLFRGNLLKEYLESHAKQQAAVTEALRSCLQQLIDGMEDDEDSDDGVLRRSRAALALVKEAK